MNITCECDHDTLLRGAYWWSMPEWLYNHPGRESTEYLGYVNSVGSKPKEFYQPPREFLTYPKGVSRRCTQSSTKLQTKIDMNRKMENTDKDQLEELIKKEMYHTLLKISKVSPINIPVKFRHELGTLVSDKILELYDPSHRSKII